MSQPTLLSSDEIRSRFSTAMSAMYRAEVPQYGTLLALVADINRAWLDAHPEAAEALRASDELSRLDVERHGAIRLGKPSELAETRRVFAVMGMYPVGYYDLSVAGVPVHSTAFRPVDDAALRRNPFRVFTSLLRLELIPDEALRQQAAEILAQRRIYSARALELTAIHERRGGLSEAEADEFVAEVLETFRWHQEATVDADTYRRLHDAHRLIADVVSFKGPHINHLTPRTLDIDAAQQAMPRHGIAAKEVVEGPPARRNPILLRQTSFKALEESIRFRSADGHAQDGTHTARFGEIEQRGMALTREGRARYDALLAQVRDIAQTGNAGDDYERRLQQIFAAFPDALDEIRRQGLAFFRYAVKDETALQRAAAARRGDDADPQATLEALIEAGAVSAQPIVYEDFLPVSAAGIFQSNLGGTEQKQYAAQAARAQFEQALGAPVLDEFALYVQTEAESRQAVLRRLQSLQTTA